VDSLSAAIAEFQARNEAVCLHDAAVASLVVTQQQDSAVRDPSRWHSVLRLFCTTAASDDYLAWLLDVEHGGDFEKRASPEEAAQALLEFAHAAVAVLVDMANQRLGDQEVSDCLRVVMAMQSCASVAPSAGEAAEQVLDRVEDLVVAGCNQLKDELGAKVQHDRSQFGRFASQNEQVCRRATNEYSENLKPVVDQMALVSRDDRMLRVRTAAAEALWLLGEDWIWSNKLGMAEESFRQAMVLGHDTRLDATIREAMERVRKARQHEQKTASKRRVSSGSGSGGGFQWRWIWVVIIGGRILATLVQSGSSSSSSPSRSYSPAPAPAPAPSRTYAPAFAPTPNNRVAAPSQSPPRESPPMFQNWPKHTAREGDQQEMLKQLLPELDATKTPMRPPGSPGNGRAPSAGPGQAPGAAGRR
jgi:hypothetical protein